MYFYYFFNFFLQKALKNNLIIVLRIHQIYVNNSQVKNKVTKLIYF